MFIDPTISCTSPSYDAWLPYVVVSIVVYPIGVPLGFAVVLWRLRDHLNPSVSPRVLNRTPSGDNVGDVHRMSDQDEHLLEQALEHYNDAMLQLRKLGTREDDPALASIVSGERKGPNWSARATTSSGQSALIGSHMLLLV